MYKNHFILSRTDILPYPLMCSDLKLIAACKKNENARLHVYVVTLCAQLKHDFTVCKAIKVLN